MLKGNIFTETPFQFQHKTYIVWMFGAPIPYSENIWSEWEWSGKTCLKATAVILKQHQTHSVSNLTLIWPSSRFKDEPLARVCPVLKPTLWQLQVRAMTLVSRLSEKNLYSLCWLVSNGFVINRITLPFSDLQDTYVDKGSSFKGTEWLFSLFIVLVYRYKEWFWFLVWAITRFFPTSSP